MIYDAFDVTIINYSSMQLHTGIKIKYKKKLQVSNNK